MAWVKFMMAKGILTPQKMHAIDINTAIRV